jgi:pyruvate dehydrogenase E2 component (dihydrolipoamide acetyltransferase)
MAVEVRLPLLGDVMQEGTLVEWLQGDGATVERGEPLYRLETDKVSLEVEAPATGVLRQLAAAGAVVPVNGLLGQILAAGEAALPAAPAGPAPLGAAATPNRPLTAESADAVRASPAARRLARELGVDLAAVARERPGGRIREEHVQAHAAARGGGPGVAGEAPAAPGVGMAGEAVVAPATASGSSVAQGAPDGAPAGAPGGAATSAGSSAAAPRGILAAGSPSPDSQGGVTHPSAPTARPAPRRQPLAGRRCLIAQRLHQSLQQMAQLTLSLQVDATECGRLREQLGRLWESEGLRPTYTDFVVRAAALALREHAALNATLEDDTLLIHAAVDVGLAVDAPEGLIVPVLRGADGLALRDLARQSAALAERARANRLTPEEVHGGTFTVTSLGALGIDFFTPIVNPPQVAILGIGRVFPRLALVGGQIEQRQAVYLSLSFDHRALDGAPAARFLNRVKELLELPVGLLQ